MEIEQKIVNLRIFRTFQKGATILVFRNHRGQRIPTMKSQESSFLLVKIFFDVPSELPCLQHSTQQLCARILMADRDLCCWLKAALPLLQESQGFPHLQMLGRHLI